MHQDNSSRIWGIAVVSVTLLAFALRLTGIDGPSFKIWDDFFALRLAIKDYGAIIHTLMHQPFDAYQEFQPPLYYFFVHAFLEFGKTDTLARLTGVLAGTLTIPAVYCLGRRLLGRSTGLVAALLLAVNVYHIEYSQQIRNYVLFLCLASWAMNFFAAWLLERTRGALFGYSLCTALMLYTSYMSTVVVATQMALWLVFFVQDARSGFGRALMAQTPFIAAAVLAGIAFLPWLPIYKNIYAVLSGIIGSSRPPLWETLSVTFREFSSYYCENLGYPEMTVPFLALALVGIWMALRTRACPAAILLAWMVITMVFVLGFNRQGLHVRTRHLIAVLPVFILFVAHPVGSLFGRSRRPRLGVTAALAVVIALNVFNFRALPFFYRREDDRLKDLCYTMATFKRDTDRQFFWGSDSKWFPDVNEIVQNWYLPGVFKRPDQDFSREYMRAWVVSAPSARQDLDAMGSVIVLGRRGYAEYSLAGIVNTSPLVLGFDQNGRFLHRETFASPLSFGLLHDLNNIVLDKGRAILRDLTGPGQATWAFTLQEGASVASVRVDFTAIFLADVSGVPDSSVTVSAAGPDGDFTSLAKFPFRELAASQNFDGKQLVLTSGVDVPRALCREGLRLRLEMDPGQDLGTISVTSVTISATGQACTSARKSQARTQLEHAMSNTLVAPALASANSYEASSPASANVLPGFVNAGRPVKDSIPMGKPLRVFTTLECDPFDPTRIGGSAALAAFREGHPGLNPVLTLEDGDVRYFLYDPALAVPALPVPGRYVLDASTSTSLTRSVSAWGLMPGAAVSLDGNVLPLASAGKEPAYVELDGSGLGRLVLTPIFAKGGPVAPGVAEAVGVKQKTDEDCLTCVDAKPCHLIYKLSAPGGFTSLTLRAYPRVFGDWRLKNGWQASISTDGRVFKRLDSLTSNASGRWDGWRVPRTSGKKWALPPHDIYLRFDLSGDGVQLWSSTDFPILIQADCMPGGVVLPSPSSTLDALGQNGAVQLLDAPMFDAKHLLRSN
ncbi:MAG: glycosyltransferase family 39 protein [Desulfovibrio sp.]|nr:glycosyltransferase family 39 protein [Desulfovibrio sp.]MBI4961087.1 glycosyltransferase family 39 protein [Desulfovibrio sp.]